MGSQLYIWQVALAATGMDRTKKKTFPVQCLKPSAASADIFDE
jgi:hypothetical protein